MLEIKNVSKTFNAGTINEKRALTDLSLSLNDGDFVTVIGGNGAGKSTLLNAVAGVWPVDSGSILIDGEDVTGMPEYKRAKYIGRVFQDPMMGTAPNMQIEENLALAYRRGRKRGLKWGVTNAEREIYREKLATLGEGWRKVFGNFSLHGGKHEGGMSSFQALATAIAAQVGTGNIVGACGAILVGGPGAIFWMWIIAFFGMSTIYAEAVLAQKTRVVNPDGTVAGGPVYYIKKAFNNAFGKFMAGFFAVAIILALGFMGAMVQSNSIGESCQNAFGIPSWVMGAIIAVICSWAMTMPVRLTLPLR